MVWDLEAPLGVWIEDRHKLGPEKIAESELYGSARLQLFTGKGSGAAPGSVSQFGGPDAVLRAVAARLLRRDAPGGGSQAVAP